MRDSHRSVKRYREVNADGFETDDSDMVMSEEDKVEDSCFNNNNELEEESEQPEIPINNNDINLNSNNLSEYNGKCIGNRNLLCLPCAINEDEDNNDGQEGAHPLVLMQEHLMEQGYKHVQQYKAMQKYTDKNSQSHAS